MKSVLSPAIAVLLLASAAPAREGPEPGKPAPAPVPAVDPAKKAKQQAGYRTRYEAMLKQPWLVDYGWITDFDKAREAAAAGKKLVVGYFTRSYQACPYCEQLVNTVLATDGFREFAKEYVLFVHITTKIDGDKYPNLMEEKGGEGFPYVAAMDAEGGVLAKLKERTLDGLRAMMKNAVDYQALKAKKDPTTGERLRLLGMDFDNNRITPKEYRAKASALEDLDDAGEQERDARILHIDIYEQMARFRGLTAPDPALRVEVGKIFAGWVSAGRMPKDPLDVGPYCDLLMDYAEAAREPDLFALAMGKMKEAYGDQKRLEFYWKQLQGRLDKLRAPAPKKEEPAK
jgi:hypothetical protein